MGSPRRTRPTRVMAAMPLSAAALLLTMAVAGCGSNRPSTENPVIPGTDLTISVTGGGKPEQTFTLSCDPIGGTLPDPKSVCARLVAPQKNPFPDPRSEIGCNLVGGDVTMRVVGTWNDRPIDKNFDQTTTCTVHAWREAAKALGLLRPVVTPTPG